MNFRRLPLLPLLCASVFGADPAASPDFFEMRVRPVLAANCYACHGSAAVGGLNLTSKQTLFKGGKSGAVVVPGKPESSLLIQAVAQTHERLKMPPSGKLAPEAIADLTAWVKAGAVWPENAGAVPSAPKPGKEYQITAEQRAFWSFQPVKHPAPPAVKNAKWAKTPIDRFILAKLEEKGLQPVGAADKRTLIRRAYFDLIGLPPKPEEIDAFLADHSPDAFAKVLDRLLDSPHYGERWGRFWLDIARYSDDKLSPQQDDPYPNAFRYRDWVVQALNQDMPYDAFVKAQLAGDLLPKRETAALGFYALSPEFQDDRVDATTRGLLGLTVACATCHDHKFDPIPQKDYYSLLGVFLSTKVGKDPLAPEAEVKRYEEAKKKLDSANEDLKEFQEEQTKELSRLLATKTSRYVQAAWQVIGPSQMKTTDAARDAKLDSETLERWVKYLMRTEREHPYLAEWDSLVKQKPSASAVAEAGDHLQEQALKVFKEKQSVDKENMIRLGSMPDRSQLANANLVSLERNKFVFWQELFDRKGILAYQDKALARWLQGEWKERWDSLQADVATRKAAMPQEYAYLHTISDVEKPSNTRIRIRGSADNLGEEAPRRFLRILSEGEPKLFTKGSGRLELAEAIASPQNPLTARVIVNRVWQRHFGVGIVRSVSNFGQLGERPSHPELLDYLASEFMRNGWSLKRLHRDIMLSAAYQLSDTNETKDASADPENRLLWRANLRRLDAETLRDSLLAVSSDLDDKVGGPPAKLTDDKNNRRTLYGFVSRRSLDYTLALFDFPNPNNTSELRDITTTPLQSLYFLNSGFVQARAEDLAKRLTGDDAARIRSAYRMIYGRVPSPEETKLGLEFLRENANAWPQYAQVLLSANEFQYVP